MQPKDFSLHDSWLETLEKQTQTRTPRLLSAIRSIHLTTGWIAFDVPRVPDHRHDLEDFIDSDDEQDWWETDIVDKHLSEMSTSHRQRAVRLSEQKRTTIRTIYRRVRSGGSRSEIRSDGVAGCLRTPRGGSSKQIVFAAGGGQLKMRWMSPREYARLQGAPDFPIKVGRNQALFGFGDAVCVLVISWIDQNIISQIVDGCS